jgi:hypothetical protein
MLDLASRAGATKNPGGARVTVSACTHFREMEEFLRLGYLQTQAVIDRLDAFGLAGIVHGD